MRRFVAEATGVTAGIGAAVDRWIPTALPGLWFRNGEPSPPTAKRGGRVMTFPAKQGWNKTAVTNPNF